MDEIFEDDEDDEVEMEPHTSLVVEVVPELSYYYVQLQRHQSVVAVVVAVAAAAVVAVAVVGFVVVAV